MQVTASFGTFVLLTTLLYGSVSAAECPANSELTSNAPCDYLCGIPCDYKGVTNVCICREGYLKDPKTNQCVLENQCSIAAEVPVLRDAPSFTFSCFT
uniref:TIL domain-containing protein n=1 Tax=Anopheles farauti TaxID=69004 RepID=A0A182R0K9_9DIPT